MTDTTASIKIIPFSGKKTDWSSWKEKFLARARRRGYKELLEGTEKIPKDADAPVATASDEDKQKYKDLRDANELAYEDLILCIDSTTSAGRVAFSCVKGSKTAEIKGGDCAVAWKRLHNKFEPKTAPSRLNLKKQFLQSNLQTRQDPDEWITDLEDLKDQLIQANSTVTDEDLLEHILNNVPETYNIEVSQLEKKLGDANNPLTIEEVRDALGLVYERLYGKKKNNNKNDDGETALFAGGFKGKCNNCGKFGHKSKDCRDKKGNKNGKGKNNDKNKDSDSKPFKWNCHYCKKPGHKAQDCFKKKRDQEQKGETAKTAQEKNEEEMSFVMLDLMNQDELGWWCMECTETPEEELIVQEEEEPIEQQRTNYYTTMGEFPSEEEDSGMSCDQWVKEYFARIMESDEDDESTDDDEDQWEETINLAMDTDEEEDLVINQWIEETTMDIFHLEDEDSGCDDPEDDSVVHGTKENDMEESVIVTCDEIEILTKSDDIAVENNEGIDPRTSSVVVPTAATVVHKRAMLGKKNCCISTVDTAQDIAVQETVAAYVTFKKFLPHQRREQTLNEEHRRLLFNVNEKNAVQENDDMCFVTIEELNDEDDENKKQCHQERKDVIDHEREARWLDSDAIVLNGKSYYWRKFPHIKGKPQMPRDPTREWNFADYYDKWPCHNEEEQEYKKELRKWKIQQVEWIKGLSAENFLIWKMKYEEREKETGLVSLDSMEIGATSLLRPSATKVYSENIYIGDTGASCHMVHSDKGMFNVKDIKEKITIGNGQYI